MEGQINTTEFILCRVRPIEFGVFNICQIEPQGIGPKQRQAAIEIAHERPFINIGAASDSIAVEKNIACNRPALHAWAKRYQP